MPTETARHLIIKILYIPTFNRMNFLEDDRMFFVWLFFYPPHSQITFLHTSMWLRNDLNRTPLSSRSGRPHPVSELFREWCESYSSYSTFKSKGYLCPSSQPQSTSLFWPWLVSVRCVKIWTVVFITRSLGLVICRMISWRCVRRECVDWLIGSVNHIIWGDRLITPIFCSFNYPPPPPHTHTHTILFTLCMSTIITVNQDLLDSSCYDFCTWALVLMLFFVLFLLLLGLFVCCCWVCAFFFFFFFFSFFGGRGELFWFWVVVFFSFFFQIGTYIQGKKERKKNEKKKRKKNEWKTVKKQNRSPRKKPTTSISNQILTNHQVVTALLISLRSANLRYFVHLCLPVQFW